MIFGILQGLFLLGALQSSSGEKWLWPEDSQAEETVRIDAKVGFLDDDQETKRINRDNIQSDDITFQQPTDTAGFYNRPPGSGRYPVRVEPGRSDDRNIRINGRPAHNDGGHKNDRYQDGTLDSLQYCRCVAAPDCEVRTEYGNACGVNQYLCCYKVPGTRNGPSEFFNEVDDERPMLYPGQSNNAGLFPPPSYQNNVFFGPTQGNGLQQGVLVGPDGPTGIVGPQKKPVLVGPDGFTDVIGPHNNKERPVLVGPGGPTGIIGPGNHINVLSGPNPTKLVGPGNNRPILVGPGGPSGVVGPASNDRPVLVGPGGPTGVIGPANNDRPILVGPGSPSGVIGPANNDRPILVGLGGPSGVIGPANNDRPVLVGPGGPTGVIGPANNDRPVLVGPGGPSGVTRPANNDRPVLVGPGGPTGVIGPDDDRRYLVPDNKPVLVGPGGPTGIIGPGNDDRNDNFRPLGNDIRQSETAQRGVLVGPGGPTGIIGPAWNFFAQNGFGSAFNRPVLVGPGGPTGVIGPRLVGPGGPTGIIGPDFSRQSRNPGILVGPGGPTGTIGPGRQILVGPGGPTGRIGPRNFFGCKHRNKNQNKSTIGKLSKTNNKGKCGRSIC